MTTTDRLAGLNGSVGMKAPCRAATTAAITLSGEQTIDGVAIVAGDRVLVKNQASSVENGIYIASTGAWSRALDFDGARDARDGTMVYVTDGTAGGNKLFVMSGTNPVTVGTSAITFAAADISGAVVTLTAGTGLTGGGTLDTDRSVALAPIADDTLLANISGGSAAPSANSLSAVIDATIGSTRGQILYRGASSWLALAAGTSGYVLTANGAGADPSWQVSGASVAVPAGAVCAFAMSTAPSGWLECDGAAVSRSTYSGLFAAISTTFGVGNGSTTFNLPDLRGEWVRGWANARSVDTGRAFGSTQAEMIGPHNHAVTDPGHTHAAPSSSNTGGGTLFSRGDNDVSSLTTSSNTTGITINNNSGTENRVRNVALMYCIKT